MENCTFLRSGVFAAMGLTDSFTETLLDRFAYDTLIDATVDIHAEKLEEATFDALIALHETE